MKRRGYILVGVVAALVLGAIFGVRQILEPPCTEVRAIDNVRIPISSIARRTVDFFCYRNEADASHKLRFLLARGSDGHIHAVFDACKECYRYHEGFVVKGGYVICRLCGTRYKINQLDVGKASCVPVALPIERRGNTIQVNVRDLEKGRGLF